MLLNINPESYIKPYKNGVKLYSFEEVIPSIKNSTASDIHLIKVDELLKLPVNVYLLNTESELQICNEQNIYTCGYDSFKDGLGTTIRVVAKNDSADNIVNNDKKTIKEKRLQIIEECHTKTKDSLEAIGLSFKVPLYDINNKIMGVFGMTARLEADASIKLDQALTCIMNTGLLPLGKVNLASKRDSKQYLPGIKFENVYFSAQESRCLHYLIRGKSIKAIAQHLGLSPRTIEHYLDNMRFKAKVNFNSELIEMAIDSMQLLG